jgi:phosphoribosylanthranilate isomerase
MRPEDAAAAVAAGADAIGMIFHPPARRNISTELAREIVASVGPFVTPVGVFVDARTETILSVSGEVGLRVVQLHGDESAEQIADLGREGLKVLKAIRVDESLEARLNEWRAAMRELRGMLVGLVLETAGQAGGSGVANDWAAARRHQEAGHFAGLPPIIASGGLDERCVADVVRMIRPWAVDVSSGVEEVVGRKSREKMEIFLEAVRG